MSESFASDDFGLPVIEITLSPCRRIAGMSRRTSSDSPLKLSATSTSRPVTIPRSPCIACTGLRTIERVPVEAKMALIFSATCRFLPTPVTTTSPPPANVDRMSFTASVKVPPMESRVASRPLISISKTSLARLICRSLVTPCPARGTGPILSGSEAASPPPSPRCHPRCSRAKGRSSPSPDPAGSDRSRPPRRCAAPPCRRCCPPAGRGR